jgi:ribosomal protein S14
MPKKWWKEQQQQGTPQPTQPSRAPNACPNCGSTNTVVDSAPGFDLYCRACGHRTRKG